jgi:hypothetical protein
MRSERNEANRAWFTTYNRHQPITSAKEQYCVRYTFLSR